MWKAIILLVLVVVATIALTYGVRWITAPVEGSLQLREDTIGSGDFRRIAYDHFYDLCASIQGLEVSLEAQYTQLSATSDSRDRAHINANIAGITAARGHAIAQYNVDARKDWTLAQFKDNSLPYQLNVNEGVRTSCGN